MPRPYRCRRSCRRIYSNSKSRIAVLLKEIEALEHAAATRRSAIARSSVCGGACPTMRADIYAR